MTPMMLPSSVAAATPGGLMNAGDPLAATSAGSPATPGTSATGEETTFNGFDVALLAILNAASLTDSEAQGGVATPSPRQTESAVSGLSTAGTWRYSFVPGGEDDEVVNLAADSSSAEAALAEGSAADGSIVVAALAGVPIKPAEITPRAMSPELSSDDDASADGFASAAPIAGVAEERRTETARGVDRGATQWTLDAGATVATGPDGEQATRLSPGDHPETTPALATRPEIDAETQRAAGTLKAEAPHEASRVGYAELSQRVPAPTTLAQAVTPPSTPPGSLLDLQSLGNPLQIIEAAAGAERSVRSASDRTPADRTAAAATLTDASGGSVQAAPDPSASLAGGRERDSARDTRQAATDGWLRRSSSIESRLAPPATFVMPVHQLRTPASTPASGVQVPFEMPAPTENLSRLVQSLRVQARDGVSEATIRLNPEHLGEVTIAVRVERGTVTAIVRAESGDVRQWLRAQEDSIRSAMAQEGMRLDKLVVEQDGQRQRGEDQEAHQQGRRNRPRGQRTAAASFTVTA